jgi:ATP adenylyltransferase
VDRLWSPWRYQYIKGETGEKAGGESCIFCKIHNGGDEAEDEHNFVLHRAAYNYIVLNIYPYTSGHLLVVPYFHAADLDAAPKFASDEMMDLTKDCQTILREIYRSDGFNIGINQGRSAGAGVAKHLHLHILPRWHGDANFMTTIAETRVLPEELKTTYNNLRSKFDAL